MFLFLYIYNILYLIINYWEGGIHERSLVFPTTWAFDIALPSKLVPDYWLASPSIARSRELVTFSGEK